MSNLIRTRSFLPLKSLQDEVDRFFGEYLPFRIGEVEPMSRMWKPVTDLAETEKEFVLKMELPGLGKEGIEVKIEEHRLVVRGERQEETKEEGKTFLSTERCYGGFFRSFTLPTAVKEDDVKAEFENGVLTIHVPKVETAVPRSIPIS